MRSSRDSPRPPIRATRLEPHPRPKPVPQPARAPTGSTIPLRSRSDTDPFMRTKRPFN